MSMKYSPTPPTNLYNLFDTEIRKIGQLKVTYRKNVDEIRGWNEILTNHEMPSAWEY